MMKFCSGELPLRLAFHDGWGTWTVRLQQPMINAGSHWWGWRQTLKNGCGGSGGSGYLPLNQEGPSFESQFGGGATVWGLNLQPDFQSTLTFSEKELFHAFLILILIKVSYFSSLCAEHKYILAGFLKLTLPFIFGGHIIWKKKCCLRRISSNKRSFETLCIIHYLMLAVNVWILWLRC